MLRFRNPEFAASSRALSKPRLRGRFVLEPSPPRFVCNAAEGSWEWGRGSGPSVAMFAPSGKKKLVERLCDRYIPKKMCWSQQRWVNFLLVRYLTVHNASAQFAYGPELVPVTGSMAFTTAPSAVRAQQLHTNGDVEQNAARKLYWMEYKILKPHLSGIHGCYIKWY